jgi:hypothetical protein
MSYKTGTDGQKVEIPCPSTITSTNHTDAVNISDQELYFGTGHSSKTYFIQASLVLDILDVCSKWGHLNG